MILDSEPGRVHHTRLHRDGNPALSGDGRRQARYGNAAVPCRASPGKPPTTADLLAALPHSFGGATVRLRDLLTALGDRGMASALLLTTLPQLLPLPLGLSNLLSLPIVAVAAQMAMGRESLWLPRWMLDRPIYRKRLDTVCARGVPLLRWLEKLVCPRLGVVWSSWGSRLVGMSCLAIALVSLAPLPFTGWLPAWALLVIGVGMLERDGLVVLAGLALGAVSVAVFLAVGSGIVELGEHVVKSAAAMSP